MKVVSLAKTTAEKQDEARPFDQRDAAEIPDYPWRLTLHLGHAEVQKLGLNRANLEAGQLVNTQGVAMVVSIDARPVMANVQRSIELQIQQLGVEDRPADVKPATILFGSAQA